MARQRPRQADRYRKYALRGCEVPSRRGGGMYPAAQNIASDVRADAHQTSVVAAETFSFFRPVSRSLSDDAAAQLSVFQKLRAVPAVTKNRAR